MTVGKFRMETQQVLKDLASMRKQLVQLVMLTCSKIETNCCQSILPVGPISG